MDYIAVSIAAVRLVAVTGNQKYALLLLFWGMCGDIMEKIKRIDE